MENNQFRKNFILLLGSILALGIVGIFLGSVGRAKAAFSGSVLITDSRIAELKNRVSSSTEPNSSAYEAMMNFDMPGTNYYTFSVNNHLNDVCQAPTDWIAPDYAIDPTTWTNMGHSIYHDGTIAYKAALAYRMTGDENYASSSVKFINCWDKINTLSTANGGDLLWSHEFEPFILAADLLKNSPSFNLIDQNNFKSFVRNKSLPESTINVSGNWGGWGLYLVTASAAYLQDQALFDSAVAKFKFDIEDQISSGGEVEFGTTITGPGQMWYEVPVYNGSSGIFYSNFGLAPLTYAAEVMKVNGVNVFNYVSPSGKTLKQAYDVIAHWDLHPETFPYYASTSINDIAFVGYMEILNEQWPNPEAEALLTKQVPLNPSGASYRPFDQNGTPVMTFTHGKFAISAAEIPPLSGWTACAVDGDYCSFGTSTKEVQYGANGTYVSKILTSGMACTSTTFGDPLPGMLKYCYYRDTVVTPPIGWYKFDEWLGNTALDSSQNNNTGTLVNGPVWTRGKLSNALSFDGINDDVSLTDVPISSSFTLAAWVNWKGGGADAFPTVIGRTGSPGVSYHHNYNLYIDKTTTPPNQLSVTFFNTAANSYPNAQSGETIAQNTWVHVAGVYDSNAKQLRLYVNGVLKDTQNLTIETPFGALGPTTHIGSGNGGTANFWNGQIDDARIYTTALSASEIYNLYSSAIIIITDTTPPTLSNIAATSATTTATITWATNEPADSQVEYGQTTSYGSSILDLSFVTTHSVSITGLSSGTIYHYHIKSKDAAGNTATSVDQTFTTLTPPPPPPDTIPPTLSNISTASITTSGAVVNWATNEPADSQVEYGLSTSYGSLTTLNSSLVTAHPVSLSSLTSGTLYHYRVKSKDAAGNLAVSGDQTFTTLTPPPPPDTTAPIISSVVATPTTSTAAVSWTTNESSDSQVEYGLSTSYGSITTLNSSLVTAHSASLSSLTSGTLYHYRVKSKDAAGNLAVSGDQTFTTLIPPPPPPAPPVITNIVVTNITSNSATITWKTDKSATSQVNYGTTSGSLNLNSPLDSNPVTSHQVTLTNLSNKTNYYFKVKSQDSSANLTVSTQSIFRTAQH